MDPLIVAEDGTLVPGYGLSDEQHQYGISKGYPPIADRLILVDFDATIVKWGPLMGDKELTDGARDAIYQLTAFGYRIGIFTSRLSRAWAVSVVGEDENAVSSFLNEQHDYVKSFLERNDIPFEFITAEKVPAQAYIDDKAIPFLGNWKEVLVDPLIVK